VKNVQPGTADFEQVLALAVRVLAQERYLFLRGRDRDRVDAPSNRPEEAWIRPVQAGPEAPGAPGCT
jgi:hypothetical protein